MSNPTETTPFYICWTEFVISYIINNEFGLTSSTHANLTSNNPKSIHEAFNQITLLGLIHYGTIGCVTKSTCETTELEN